MVAIRTPGPACERTGELASRGAFVVQSRRLARRAPPLLGLALLMLSALGPPGALAATPSCVYVSSYHVGYSWSDRIEQALRATIGERCRIVSSYMDTKRKRRVEEIQAAAEDAMRLIRDIRPTVVIVSDDNAARHLVVPHLKGSGVPVVFAGLNWTVEEYGFPWSNVTGIVEVSPLQPMLELAAQMVPNPRRAAYIGANTPSEWKNFARLKREAQRHDIQIYAMLVDNMVQFEGSFNTAQHFDFLVLGGSAGIRDWDPEAAALIARRHTGTLSLTTRDWMMRYTMIGLTKVPEEQGEWAGASAIAILDGRAPATIPLATNRHWESWVNLDLLAGGGFEPPARVMLKARRVASQ